MADHYNHYPLTHFAATVADCMDLPLPAEYAPPVAWASSILKERLGGTADRVVLYHADAVGLYIWQKYTPLFAPVCRHTSLAIPFLSTVESVTPVAHASMYTGLDPEGHGIRTYVRPQLACSTLYDELVKAGRRAAILAMADSTFLHIFTGRPIDYFAAANAAEIREKALELIASDRYDLISIHTFEYDNAAHAYGPESKEGLNAVSLEAEVFGDIAREMKTFADRHRLLLSYSPDHGQHLTEGGTGAHGSRRIEDMNIVHFFGTFGG
ncbi:MAG: alkaline phosphatase family protein [Clostridia bacterium]|nr:alkaline phosphatase family protein [Clostridia bacterium]